jgi:ABC-type nickel/cobalt efflux system permease component RcnA
LAGSARAYGVLHALAPGHGKIIVATYFGSRAQESVPTVLGDMLQDPDAAKAKRVMGAMMKMTKLDIGLLKQAYEQR